MKLLLVSLAVLLITGTNYAQRATQAQQKSEEAQTRVEIFQAKTGAVLIKNYSDIGAISGLGGTITVTSYEFADAQTGRKEYGLGIEAKESGRLEREARSYVDYDEISSLIAGIDYISKVDGSQSKLKNFEAHYKTKGELDVTVFSGRGRIEAAVSVGRFGAVSVFLQLDALQKFRQVKARARKNEYFYHALAANNSAAPRQSDKCYCRQKQLRSRLQSVSLTEDKVLLTV